jgi:DNA-binding transcriptional MocR family regulator
MTPRLCSWLLAMRQVLHSDTIELTQEAIAHLLGLSRPKVSVALANLEDRQYIRSRHGRLRVLDPRALESCRCSCPRLTGGLPALPTPALLRSTPPLR